MSEPGPRTALRLRDVTVRYPRRDRPVLQVDGLEVSAGEHVLVLGPSRAGKSTLLHLASGLVPHVLGSHLAGQVEVCGLGSEAGVAERSRRVGVVAQDPASAVCLPTVEQEVVLPLENHAVDPGAIDGRVGEVLAAVGAAGLRGRRTHELSGGEAQRVALAAALATRPDLLVLDEPTSMLDPAGVSAVTAVLASGEVRRRATLLVEHRLDELGRASALPGRAVVLDGGGRLVADGPTGEVLARRAAMLRSVGCWLPLEHELRAVTGRGGGTADPLVRRVLGDLAGAGSAPDPARPRGAVLLEAHDLAVGRTRGRGRHRVADVVLSRVALEVREGEVVAVLGPNGAGKSSLLLTLAGLLPPLAGRVTGERPGMVFQNPEHQFLTTTVRDEVAHGLPDPGRDEVVGRQLRRFRLDHLADRSPYRLSGGEKRRLGLAAMQAHDRRVLLLDEPTWGLDRRASADVAAALRGVRAVGGGALLASHDLRFVASVADRVVVLGRRGVLAHGPTGRVLADRRVRDPARLRLPPLVAGVLDVVGPERLRDCLAGLDAAPSTAAADVAVGSA